MSIENDLSSFGRSPQREYKKTFDFDIYQILGFGIGIIMLFNGLSANKIHKSMSMFGIAIVGIVILSFMLPSYINYGKQYIQSVYYSMKYFARRILERILKYV